MRRLRLGWASSLVLATVLQWGCATSQEKEQRFLARGKQHLEQKDFSRAILEFRNAVHVAPRDDQAYYQLGWAFLGQRDLRDAAVAMKKATELNPRNTMAQVKLAELLVLAGTDDLAKQSENRMRDLLNGLPDNPDALTALALAELRFGDTREGEQHLRRALEKFPENLQSSMILARLKLESRDFTAAEQILRQAAEHNPTSTEAALGLAEFYRVRERWTEAEGEFRKVLEVDQKNAMALAGLAAAQARTGQKSQAEQSYRELAALPDKRYNYYHAAYLFQEGQRDAAIAEFLKLAKHDPNDRDARTRLVSAYLLANRRDDAKTILGSALRRNPKDVDALLQRAQILVAEANPGAARRDLVQVLLDEPNAPLAHYLLSKVDQADGKTQQRRQELGETLRLQPNLLGVRIELAQAYLEAGEAKTALDVMNAAPPSQQHALTYIVQRNWALLATGNLQDLATSVQQGLALGRVPDLLLQGGLLELQLHNYPRARFYFSEALDRNPEDLRSLEALARSYAEQGQSSIAFQKVREYAARKPKSAPLQEYLGEQLQISGNLAEARDRYNAAKTADPTYTRTDLAAAQLDMAEGRLDDARKRASALLAANKELLPANLILADLEVKAGKYEAAVERYRKALEIAPENLRALNDMAYVLAEYRNRPDEALKYAQHAAEIAPDDPVIEDTMGWVLYRKGLYDMALKYLKSAAANSNVVAIKYHLAMAYMKSGRTDLGRQGLEAALRANPAAPEAQAATQLLRAAGVSK